MPSPSGPNPSMVGTPKLEAMEASDPPPVFPASRGILRVASAISRIWERNADEASVFSIGGVEFSTEKRIFAPGEMGPSCLKVSKIFCLSASLTSRLSSDPRKTAQI